MMDKVELRRCQIKQLEALKFIDSICKENGLVYYVHTGTLLGAVRHRGYIPWDMDTDLLMPEDDCKKLLTIIRELNCEDYSVIFASESWLISDRIVLNKVYCHDPNRKDDDGKIHIGISSYSFGKHYPDCARKVMNLYSRLLANIIAFRNGKATLNPNKKGYLFKKIILQLGYVLTMKQSDQAIRDRIRNIACSKNNSGLISIYNSFYGFSKETYPIEYFMNIEYVEFEDIKVPIPGGYANILRNLYGNWKEYPDEMNRYPKNLDELVYEENGASR